jgi:hypothetical protein
MLEEKKKERNEHSKDSQKNNSFGKFHRRLAYILRGGTDVNLARPEQILQSNHV